MPAKAPYSASSLPETCDGMDSVFRTLRARCGRPWKLYVEREIDKQRETDGQVDLDKLKIDEEVDRYLCQDRNT